VRQRKHAPGLIGHSHGTLGIVDLDRPLDRTLGLGGLAGRVEDVAEVLVRLPF